MPYKQQYKNNKHVTRHIGRWVAIMAIMLIALIGVGILVGRGNDTARTHLTLTANAPGITMFSSNTPAIINPTDNIPDINNIRTLSKPPKLVISYDWASGPYAPAFKPNISSSDINKNIKITPFIRGKWQLRGDSAIVFTPDAAWPADRKYGVMIDRDILNQDVTPDRTRITFTTPRITATTDSFNIYPSPTTRGNVIGVAVISFNYPIKTTGFADHVNLRLDGERLDFTVRFDRFHRTAIITSAPVHVADNAQTMRLKINKLSAATGNARTDKLTAHTTIPATDNIFKITDIESTIADNTDDRIQQLILLNTTYAASKDTDWNKYITVYLLPKTRNADEDKKHTWLPDEVTTDVLKSATKIKLKPTNFVTPGGVYQYAFEYQLSNAVGRYMYVSVRNGIESNAGFVMKNGLATVLPVAYPQRMVKIAGTGALLSLGGDKKLGLMARGGVETAYINLSKVKSTEINHLISQTYNVFANNMEYKSWSFGTYDMATVFQKQISFSDTNPARTNYASVNLGDYLDRTGTDKTGIFIIQAATSKSAADFSDRRLILLTDMGMIHKVNLDGSSTLFVSNLSSGRPAGDVAVSILGRNGNNVWAGRTNSDGVVELPRLDYKEYKNAREPIAIVARRSDDVSFIPYRDYANRSDYSKFETDGTYASSETPLNAFLFSDRGIYRPGETATIAGIIKAKSFKSVSGIPVELTIRDARGRITMERMFSLSSDGLFDIKYPITTTSPIGEYQISLHTVSNNHRTDIIGTATIQIAEFVPDTMKITANIPGASDVGWISSDNLVANVSLHNLVGTPAVGNRISAHGKLTPVTFTFRDYNEYVFTPNFIGDGISDNTARRATTFDATVTDVTTDDNGNAKLNMSFEQPIPDGTYNLNLTVSGFEPNSGRNVQTTIRTRVSNDKYLVGYYANGALDYINRNAVRIVKLIALDHTGTPTPVDGLNMKLIKRENLVSLIKDYNNFYKYQTVTRDRTISKTRIDIPAGGTTIPLTTTDGGTYFVQITDAADKILANIEYFVATDENSALNTDTDAQMQIKLNSATYTPGDEISINITAPYRGSGLITIERDKVYAYKWFHADNTISSQTIRVPNDFRGTGYVNVSFVRDINSRDVFTTPYTYAAAPFTSDINTHRIDVKLNAPTTISDDSITIGYETNRNARMMIFAVNSGILQVAKYKIPNPLAHFFAKSALQVDTFQTLSLLLPEYKILREFAKTGGGDYNTGDEMSPILTNPFGRHTLPSVAFYSGIIDTTANTPGQITFDIPDYFDGTLRIFAVATNDSAVGSGDVTTTVQSPIMISANAPLFAAPGDTFDINAVITNMTENTDTTNADINISISDNITITSAPKKNTDIPHGAQKLATFTATTGDTPGNADISITAQIGDTSRSTTTSMSVRPATNYQIYSESGMITDKTTRVRKSATDMYSAKSMRKLFISANAAAYMRPLVEYLKNYEFTCTEQLVSRTIPYAVASGDAILAISSDDAAKYINDTINTLKNRQNDDGSFALWTADTTSHNNTSDADTTYLTAYVTQFLDTAKNAGFTVPQQMQSRAIDYLRTWAGQNITSADNARAMAYAIYIITRGGFVTTGYINSFTEYADTNIRDWESDLMGAYIAAAYKILRQDKLANELIAQYRAPDVTRFEYASMFRNNVADVAAYYDILNRYFTAKNPSDNRTIATYIADGNYSAYTSAMVILAMSGKNKSDNIIPTDIVINTNGTDITPERVGNGLVAEIPMHADKITITCPTCNDKSVLYFSLIQSGYPIESTPMSNGLAITREYYDMDGNRIISGKIGDMVTVRMTIRTRGMTDFVENVAIVDLMPGGFIANSDSVTAHDADFSAIYEDRVLIFTPATRAPQTITYTATLGAAGTFVAPAPSAISMYNPSVRATGVQSEFTVSNETTD